MCIILYIIYIITGDALAGAMLDTGMTGVVAPTLQDLSVACAHIINMI